MSTKPWSDMTRTEKAARVRVVSLVVAVVTIVIASYLLTLHGMWPGDDEVMGGDYLAHQELAVHLVVRVVLLTLAVFTPLWIATLQDRRTRESAVAAGLLVVGAFASGYLALAIQVLPERAEWDHAQSAVNSHKIDNQVLLDHYAARMGDLSRDFTPHHFVSDARSPERPRQAIAEAIALIDSSRKAYAATLMSAPDYPGLHRLDPVIQADAMERVKRNHAALTRYWDYQGQYAAILREMLTILDRRDWAVEDDRYVFDNRRDHDAWQRVDRRLEALSAAIDQDIAERKAAEEASY